MSVISWTVELKEELCNTGLGLVWMREQDCNLREMTKMFKDRCNDTEGQNTLPKLSEKSSLAQPRNELLLE
jgi:hypothetical protein